LTSKRYRVGGGLFIDGRSRSHQTETKRQNVEERRRREGCGGCGWHLTSHRQPEPFHGYAAAGPAAQKGAAHLPAAR